MRGLKRRTRRHRHVTGTFSVLSCSRKLLLPTCRQLPAAAPPFRTAEHHHRFIVFCYMYTSSPHPFFTNIINVPAAAAGYWGFGVRSLRRRKKRAAPCRCGRMAVGTAAAGSSSGALLLPNDLPPLRPSGNPAPANSRNHGRLLRQHPRSPERVAQLAGSAVHEPEPRHCCREIPDVLQGNERAGTAGASA